MTKAPFESGLVSHFNLKALPEFDKFSLAESNSMKRSHSAIFYNYDQDFKKWTLSDYTTCWQIGPSLRFAKDDFSASRPSHGQDGISRLFPFHRVFPYCNMGSFSS